MDHWNWESWEARHFTVPWQKLLIRTWGDYDMCQMSKGTPLTSSGICHTQGLREIAESWGGPPGKDLTDLVRWLCNFNYFLLVFFFGVLGNCPSLTFGSLLGRTIKPFPFIIAITGHDCFGFYGVVAFMPYVASMPLFGVMRFWGPIEKHEARHFTVPWQQNKYRCC